MGNSKAFFLVALVLSAAAGRSAELVTVAEVTRSFQTPVPVILSNCTNWNESDPQNFVTVTVTVGATCRVYSDGVLQMDTTIYKSEDFPLVYGCSPGNIHNGGNEEARVVGLTAEAALQTPHTGNWSGASSQLFQFANGSASGAFHQVVSSIGELDDGENGYLAVWAGGVHPSSGSMPLKGGVVLFRISYQSDGITPWVDVYGPSDRTGNVTNESSTSKWYRLVGKDGSGNVYQFDRRLVAPGESHEWTIDNVVGFGAGIVRWEIWEEWDGVPMRLVDWWNVDEAGQNQTGTVPSTPPTVVQQPPADTDGSVGGSSGGGGGGSTGGGGGVALPGGTSPQPDNWNSPVASLNVGTVPGADGDVLALGDRLATLEGAAAGLAGVLPSYGTLPVVDGKSYDLSRSITLPAVGTVTLNLDMSPYEDWIEMFRTMIGIVCAFFTIRKGVEIIRWAVA